MTEHIQQIRHLHSNGDVSQRTDTITDDGAPARAPSATAARVVWYIAGVIIVLLAIRFVFVLLGANQGNGFVDFIYNVSYPFAAPFFGIFNYNLHYGISRFELSTLVAMAIYALIAWGVERLLTIRQGDMRV